MKKTVAFLLLSVVVFTACQKKSNEPTAAAIPEIPKDANGYTLPSSANIDFMKKCNAAWEAGKVDEYKTYYADNAIFHDNAKQTTLAENVAFNLEFKKNGMQPTIKYDVIWENVDFKADEKGVKNYVLAYCTNTWTKGTKSIKSVTFQVDAIKDGKIVEEWNIYDSAPLIEFAK